MRIKVEKVCSRTIAESRGLLVSLDGIYASGPSWQIGMVSIWNFQRSLSPSVPLFLPPSFSSSLPPFYQSTSIHSSPWAKAFFALKLLKSVYPV